LRLFSQTLPNWRRTCLITQVTPFSMTLRVPSPPALSILLNGTLRIKCSNAVNYIMTCFESVLSLWRFVELLLLSSLDSNHNFSGSSSFCTLPPADRRPCEHLAAIVRLTDNLPLLRTSANHPYGTVLHSLERSIYAHVIGIESSSNSNLRANLGLAAFPMLPHAVKAPGTGLPRIKVKVPANGIITCR
jgi:hypothetical protein